MDDHARTRLAHFGRLCSCLGVVAQILGETLAHTSSLTAADANDRIRAALLEAAETCDDLGQYSVDTAHIDPAYDGDDATAMALLFRVLDHLGRVVADISEFRLFDPAGAKYETWIEVGGHLREAALAAGNRADYAAALATGTGGRDALSRGRGRKTPE